MVKRFATRFQLWMRDVADEFEDKSTGCLLFLAVIFVVSDGYTLFATHHLALDSLLGTALFAALVVLYLRQARWTWIPLMLLAVRFVIYLPLYRPLFSKPNHLVGKIFVVAFVLGLAGAMFVFSLTLRKRFANSIRTI